jgi:hypothetical protein
MSDLVQWRIQPVGREHVDRRLLGPRRFSPLALTSAKAELRPRQAAPLPNRTIVVHTDNMLTKWSDLEIFIESDY